MLSVSRSNLFIFVRSLCIRTMLTFHDGKYNVENHNFFIQFYYLEGYEYGTGSQINGSWINKRHGSA